LYITIIIIIIINLHSKDTTHKWSAVLSKNIVLKRKCSKTHAMWCRKL